ncbi:MAG: hypothetical protein NVSMB25_02350 [Thermoleophilaceae bacterium]
MTARLTIALAAAALVAALTAGLTDGFAHGAATLAVCLVCAAPIALLSHALAARRRALGSLTLQFSTGAALAFGLVLVALGAIVLFMFVPLRDAGLLGALLLFAGALSCYSAAVLGRGVKQDIDAIRDRLTFVGDGGRGGQALAIAGRDEIAGLATAAEQMARQLAERESERDAADRSRRDLIAAVSHDLRTPLTSLQLLAEAIDDGLLGANGGSERYLREMTLHVRSMSTLVDDLFELTRLESGEINWSMQQVHLDELVGETVEAMRSQAAQKRIAVRAVVPGDLPAARANPEGVQRVLFNLIQNALRYTPADGSVTIAAQSSASAVEIEVADSGVGIESSERELVFEPFFRGRREASRTRTGSGLGLSICRAIIEVHGGRIWLEPSHKGTRVRFTLPLAA